jgi:phosphatidylglycerophosphate synthase
MLDRYTVGLVKRPLQILAEYLKKAGISADQVSLAAFIVGLLVLPLLYKQFYLAALVCIIINRIGDGVDGALARMTGVSDAGGFLDIVLDFFFYSAVVLGFALADSAANGLAAATLLLSFVGTGSSFLAFAIMAERRGIENIVYPHKGIYYLQGLAEGTETIIFFVLCCLFPSSFAMLAYSFAALCFITTLSRIYGGYTTLKK